MANETMNSFRQVFVSRLTTLSRILELSQQHFHHDVNSLLGFRLVDDMLPFSTQIVYACNQPNNFVRWCEGKESKDIDPHVASVDHAKGIIEQTASRLMAADLQDSKLAEIKRIELGEGRYIELAGLNYVEEFLMPNFYFHLVTAYNIMRMKGVPLGKAKFMMHLLPLVKQT